jgi:hypothetical protein
VLATTPAQLAAEVWDAQHDSEAKQRILAAAVTVGSLTGLLKDCAVEGRRFGDGEAHLTGTGGKRQARQIISP